MLVCAPHEKKKESEGGGCRMLENTSGRPVFCLHVYCICSAYVFFRPMYFFGQKKNKRAREGAVGC